MPPLYNLIILAGTHRDPATWAQPSQDWSVSPCLNISTSCPDYSMYLFIGSLIESCHHLITGVSGPSLLYWISSFCLVCAIFSFFRFWPVFYCWEIQNTRCPISVLLQIDKLGSCQSLYFIYQSNSVLAKVFRKHIWEKVEHVCYVAFIA